jgi:hypothetical protein
MILIHLVPNFISTAAGHRSPGFRRTLQVYASGHSGRMVAKMDAVIPCPAEAPANLYFSCVPAHQEPFPGNETPYGREEKQ